MTDDRRRTTDDRQPTARADAVVGGRWSVVVIGYGNDLRGDDAVGPLAAAAVAKWDAPGVWALAVHQLTPELAASLAAADLAIFVDARAPASAPRPGRPSPPLPPGESGLGGEGEEMILVHPLEPTAVDAAIGHTGDPGALLALTKALYGRYPVAWSITVPARSFAFGAGLSLAAERGLASALQRIDGLVSASGHPTYQP
jgi:Ni,Fe-hydrogenase maturation factor